MSRLIIPIRPQAGSYKDRAEAALVRGVRFNASCKTSLPTVHGGNLIGDIEFISKLMAQTVSKLFHLATQR